MDLELECHNLDVPQSRNQQIWCRSDLGLQREKFYAAFYAIQQLQRQQQTEMEIKVDSEKSLENLFLDRLALLFARIKNDSRKTPANVTATGLVRHDSRWDVFIAKNDGFQDGNQVSPESEKSFAKKLQDWIREEANEEALSSDDDDDDSIDDNDDSDDSSTGEGDGSIDKAEPMTTKMANFWKDRIIYYVKESKAAWDKLNEAKISVEAYLQKRDQKFTKRRFEQDWDKAVRLVRYLRNRPADKAITTKFLKKFYRFWNRKEREDWHKPLESDSADARNFRKCIRYMEMLGMPISTWRACVRFRKLPDYKTVHLIAIDKPIFCESRLDKDSIVRIFKWWKTKNSAIKVSLPSPSPQDMMIKPELFFHCELQILTLLTLKYLNCGHHFIGCSKLSCESCWQILKNDAQFTTRGSHHKVSANCAFPFPSNLETIGRSIRHMQSTWKKTVLSDLVKRSNLPIDDTEQARTRWNGIAEESAINLPVYSLDTNPYTIDRNIKPSGGSFARVYLATKHDQASSSSISQPSASYALKIIDITSPKKSNMVKKEIEILSQLQSPSHRNILRLEEAFRLEDSSTVFLATQPYAPLSLEKFFTKTLLYDHEEWYEPHQLLPWPEIIRQCLEGLKFLHKQEPQILHLDLKPQNILLHKEQGGGRRVEIRPIIIDFGISTDLPVENSTHRGTLEYMSPEVLNGASHTIFSDIWALGCCFAQIFVLLYGGVPSLGELREAIHNPDQRGFSKNLEKVDSMLYQSDGKNYTDRMLEVFVDFREEISSMLIAASKEVRPTTQVSLAYFKEFKAHLEVVKLNISGLTICLTFGSWKFSRRFDGPNLPNVVSLVGFCKENSDSPRPPSTAPLGFFFLWSFLRPSPPRLVYLTLPKNQKQNVIKIEDALASTLSFGKRKRKSTIDSTQRQPQSPYPKKLSTDQEAVNNVLQSLWKIDQWNLIHQQHQPWAFSLHVFQRISKLSEAWTKTTDNSSPITTDRECGLEVRCYVDTARLVLFAVTIVYVIYVLAYRQDFMTFSITAVIYGTMMIAIL